MPTGTPTFCGAFQKVADPISRTAGTADFVIDTLGYKWLNVLAAVGQVEASGTLDISLRESDNADGSSSAAFNNDADTPAAMALTQFTPTRDNLLEGFEVYVPSRKRYIVVRLVTATAANVTAIMAFLSGGKQSAVQTPEMRSL